jgi:hypothetical protein
MTGTTTGQFPLAYPNDSDDVDQYSTVTLPLQFQAIDDKFHSSTGHDHNGSGKGKPITALGSGLTITTATLSGITTMSSGDFRQAKGVDVSSAGAMTLGNDGNTFVITGATTINTIAVKPAGTVVRLKFAGALTLTHSAAGTSNGVTLRGAANMTTVANQVLELVSDGTGWYEVGASSLVTLVPLTNSLGADVNLNNASNFFDGPTVAQGTTGTWMASGAVSVGGPTSSNLDVKLWDGTTVIASARSWFNAAANMTVSLSGPLTTPAGNIRISVRSSATDAVMRFNTSGQGKDSTVTVERKA